MTRFSRENRAGIRANSDQAAEFRSGGDGRGGAGQFQTARIDHHILIKAQGVEPQLCRDFSTDVSAIDQTAGGDHRGMRMNTLYRDNVSEAQIVEALDPLFARYASERHAGEHFGDFLHRAGIVALPAYPTHVQVAPQEGQ